jgi:cystathionine gamma-synthase
MLSYPTRQKSPFIPFSSSKFAQMAMALTQHHRLQSTKGALGDALPLGEKHVGVLELPFLLRSLPFTVGQGISVLLPTWENAVGWSSRNPEVLTRMKTGYPRFFIPRIVDDLATQLLHRAPLVTRGKQEVGKDGWTPSAGHDRLALLFPCCRYAEQCRHFLVRVGMAEPSQVQIYTVRMTDPYLSLGVTKPDRVVTSEEVYAVAYAADLLPHAKSFWQHTGRGISSRFATYWLENAQFLGSSLSRPISSQFQLPIEEANEAKVILRKRAAALSSTDTVHVRPEHVYLYPTGMSSICNTADVVQQLDLKRSAVRKVAVFG